MNCGAATVFLPKLVGFPSLRGLHSSTVQLRRAPGHVSRIRIAGPMTGTGSATRILFPLITPNYPQPPLILP